jgi:hypothetical protein
MATQFVEGQPRLREEGERHIEHAGAGATVAAICAAAAVVLTIIGLAGGLPGFLLSIATILLGAAFLFEGGSVMSRHHHMAREAAPPHERFAFDSMRGGMTVETMVGIAGIVLGILSIIGIARYPLEPIMAIVFGGGLVLGTAHTSRVHAASHGLSDTTRGALHELGTAYSGADVLVGCGAIVLGILALIGLDPMTLTKVAVLAVSAAVLLSGTGVGARMLGVLRHHPAHQS